MGTLVTGVRPVDTNVEIEEDLEEVTIVVAAVLTKAVLERTAEIDLRQ